MARIASLLPKVALGALLVLGGVALILHNLGQFEIQPYLKYWPALLILVGLVRLIDRCGWLGSLLFIAVGGILLADNLDWIKVDLFDFWPLIFVFLGISIVRRAIFGPRGGGASAEAAPVVSAFTMMGGLERKNDSQAFRGGDVTAVMGGAVVDLRGAKIAGDSAEIEIFAFWGGIDLIVPEGWTVESRVVPLLGAFEDKTAGGRSAGVEPTGRLVVRGFVVMGGAEVKNQPTECECTPSSPRRAD